MWSNTIRTGLVISTLSLWWGCVQQDKTARLDEARQAYQIGRYAVAYRNALLAMPSGTPRLQQEAAYMAGLAASQLNDHQNTERYLSIAAKSQDPTLAGDSMTVLGLSYATRGLYRQAARTFLNAAPRLRDQDRANAYFHAAKAQQKLGQWASARTHLSLSLSSSQNNAFRKRILQELNTTGFTLQIGAFADKTNARRAAENLLATINRLHLGAPRLVPAKDAQGQPVYLIQIGQFSSYTSALAAGHTLKPTSTIIVPLVSHTLRD